MQERLAMKMLALLCSALIVGLSALPVPSQAREGGYGGFTQENMHAFNNYINALAMIKVQAGEELNQAIDAIPIDLETAIDSEQERGLRDWLRQYLIAFSEAGNDSLAAVFYLREGFDAEHYKKIKIEWAEFRQRHVRRKNSNVVAKNIDGSAITDEEIENMVEKTRERVETALREESPLSIIRSDHRETLRSFNKEHFIENVSFRDSEFRVFELNKGDQTFFSLAKDRGMLPRGFVQYSPYPKLKEQLPALLEAGERTICADILFIVEEPSASAPDPTMPGRTPSFFRLLWDREEKLWRHLEVFYSQGVVEAYFFGHF